MSGFPDLMLVGLYVECIRLKYLSLFQGNASVMLDLGNLAEWSEHYSVWLDLNL